MQVTFKQVAKDATPKNLHDMICGEIKEGIFIPNGSVSTHFFIRQREINNISKNKKQDVYFISDEIGNIKIGIAENIQSRLSLLQTGNSQKLTLVKSIKNAGRKTEKELHNKYIKHHIRGEWYTSEVLTF